MNNKPNIDCVIYISKEDNKYLVHGGIGTYLGVLSKTIKELFPDIKVFWITKSPNEKDFIETDEYGVLRHYISGLNSKLRQPFQKLLDKNFEDLSEKITYNFKVTDTVKEILHNHINKNIIIETGEWEGLGIDLFKLIDRHNVGKIVRLHTPLATCIRQNNLSLSASNNYQLLFEEELIRSSDCISACTEHVKSKILEDVIGKHDSLAKEIVTLPNPIDVKSFAPHPELRVKSINCINTILNEKFITDTTCNVYFVGSVESRKGVEFIIDSVPNVIENDSNVRFCFIGHCGDDNDKNLNANTKLSPKKLLSRIPKRYHNFIRFTNYVSHSKLPLIMQSGDIFPIMSIGDNFPGTVAEIALTGKMILALERGGVKEMLRDENSRMVAIGLGSSLDKAAENLGNRIIKYSRDATSRDAVGKSLYDLIIRKYSPEVVTSQILDMYCQVLARKNSMIERKKFFGIF
jgi:glycosyltransferase involved in cell wall biosynthesis